MILSYKRDMTHNYMVPESEDTIPRQDYQINMMMENHIEGLLPCSIKRVNGKSRYFYDITSRQSMESIYEKEQMGEKDIRMLLKGLYLALMEVKRFLLDANKVVLDPQVIYMDIETKEPLFTYLPSHEGEILEAFHRFAAHLLEKLDQTDTEAVLLGYEVYRRSMMENYSLEKLLKEVAYGGDEVAKSDISVPQNSMIHSVQVPLLSERVEEPAADTRPKEIPVTAAAEQKNDCSKIKKDSGKKKIFLLSGIVTAAAAGIGVAAWFWKLTVTQLGGIAFLLASILAYGISADGKRKKEQSKRLRRQEEKADRRSARKMKRMEKTEAQAAPKNESPRKQEIMRKLEPSYAAETTAVREKVGATVLLSPGEEEYVPHLSLISMSPRERNSVVLLNESYTIGKLKNKVDICIDHPSISRIHARIQKEGKEYFLYDLNSTNGTYVNGRRLAVNERVQIQLSDEIRFADLGYYVGKC